MQQVLTDMHIADAIINSDPSTFRDDEAKKALFQSVFDKHRVTEAKYDSSLIWYGKNLDVYMQVYTMALADVKRRIEIIGPIESEKTYSPNKDSVDIWTIDRYVEFSPASLSNLVVFNFQEREEYSSGSVFVLGMNVWGLASGRIPPIEVHLRAEQSDTTLIVQNSIRTDGYHELILRSVPTKRVKQVHGYIRLGNDTIPYRKIYFDNFRMMKYLYGSEAIN